LLLYLLAPQGVQLSPFGENVFGGHIVFKVLLLIVSQPSGATWHDEARSVREY